MVECRMLKKAVQQGRSERMGSAFINATPMPCRFDLAISWI
jgi:hypothetical protein